MEASTFKFLVWQEFKATGNDSYVNDPKEFKLQVAVNSIRIGLLEPVNDSSREHFRVSTLSI